MITGTSTNPGRTTKLSDWENREMPGEDLSRGQPAEKKEGSEQSARQRDEKTGDGKAIG
jgi:hypothetical protein